MDKRRAAKEASRAFGLPVTFASGFMLSSDHTVVMVACSEAKSVLVLNDETDIHRLMSMCNMALSALQKHRS